MASPYRTFAAAFTLALSAAPLSGAQQAAPAAAQSDEEVVVTGRTTEEALRAFVGQMAVAQRGENQMARWDRKVCPGIAGLRTRYAQFINDRMAQRAYDVGLDVGEPGCKANILILVSSDPDAYARELVNDFPAAMNILDARGRSSPGRRDAQRFAESDAPVRWWHVAHTVTQDGGVIAEHSVSGEQLASDHDYPVVRSLGGSSRLNRGTHQDFGSAFIIIDARALNKINFDWAALADYLAMVALAQLDARADTATYPTILNLFAERSTVRALTDWDAAYLRGLYGATRDTATAGRQEGEIARSMNRDLNAPQN